MATLSVAGEVCKSTVFEYSLFPTWDERFSFVLLDGAVGELRVLCEDFDKYSANDYMGTFVVPLAGLPVVGADDTQPLRAWFDLSNADGAHDKPPPTLLKSGAPCATRERELDSLSLSRRVLFFRRRRRRRRRRSAQTRVAL